MAKTELERVTDEHVAKGGVQAKLYFDMQNKEKDKLQPLLVDLINQRLLKEKGVIYCYGMIDEPLEKDGLFITSAIVTVLTDNFFSLANIAFNYSPAGVEVLKPHKEIVMRPGDLQKYLMDLSQMSLNYSKYILEKVMKPEDIQKISTEIENRVELGKKMMEKKDGAEPAQ
ncbi:MAG TPA: hypothetical protein VMV00_01725 [Candidatus Baltobacteraceae bacterium]|nr:hypothetical protein [Candidatus Baltobacteraceae bacterium]